jgi:hypothetical protein
MNESLFHDNLMAHALECVSVIRCVQKQGDDVGLCVGVDASGEIGGGSSMREC